VRDEVKDSFVWCVIIQRPSFLEGFPDFAPPKHVTDALADVAKEDNILLHQYTRGYVHTCSSYFNYLGVMNII
jgi:hypothetical protein